MLNYLAITDIYIKKGKSNICQKLYSYNSVQLMSIKHLLCAERPAKQWEANTQKRAARTEPAQFSAPRLGKVAMTRARRRPSSPLGMRRVRRAMWAQTPALEDARALTSEHGRSFIPAQGERVSPSP